MALLSKAALQKFWIEFIKIYETQTALWKSSAPEYRNRVQKKRGYQKLLAKMREIQPTANITSVKKKINSLRSNYRRKYLRWQEDQRLGLEPSSKWFYLDYLKFLEFGRYPLPGDVEEEEMENGSCDESRSEKAEENSQEYGVLDETETMIEIDTPYNKVDNSASTHVLHQNEIVSPIEELNEDYSRKIISTIEAEQKFWIEFIQLYESHPALWKYGCKEYQDRELKRLAYNELVEKMQQVEPDADIDMVKRKINALRSTYRRALNKRERAIRQGETANIYWIYFEHFSFLHDNKKTLEKDEVGNSKRIHDNRKVLEYEDNSNADESFTYADETYDNGDEEMAIITGDENTMIEEVELKPTESWKRQYQSTSPSPSSNHSYKKVCIETPSKLPRSTNDEADILGMGWAYQYRNLSESQKLFAKKAIDDILFEARLETLHRQSVRINDSICQHCKGSLNLKS